MWEVRDTGVAPAQEIMAYDAHLLERLAREKRPILHFYEWASPSLTYGHFIDIDQWLKSDVAKRTGLTCAKRPTGGGIVFHLWDMAFSALVPAHAKEFSLNTLENYAFINEAVLRAVEELSPLDFHFTLEDLPAKSEGCAYFCMARPTKYDVILKGKKIAGAAQRKTKEGFLHQGTISILQPDPDYLQALLKPGTGVLEAILSHSFSLAKTVQEASLVKEKLKIHLTTHLNHLSANSMGCYS